MAGKSETREYTLNLHEALFKRHLTNKKKAPRAVKTVMTFAMKVVRVFFTLPENTGGVRGEEWAVCGRGEEGAREGMLSQRAHDFISASRRAIYLFDCHLFRYPVL